MKKWFSRHSSQSTMTTVFLSCAVFLFLVLMLHTSLPDATVCIIEVKIDHDDTFQLYYQDTGDFTQAKVIQSTEIKANKRTTISFPLNQLSIKKLRIDPGSSKGVIKIYRLEIHSNYHKPVIYLAEDLYPLLIPGSPGLTVQKENDCLRIISETDDPYLIATKPLHKNNLVLVYGLSLLAALIVSGRLLRGKPQPESVSQQPAAKSPSKGNHIHSLNGLRGIAIMMVVGEHTCGRLAGFGTGGVWLFMALSGFLLAKPYIQKSELALSWSYINTFYWRRLQRIIPIYYFYIVVTYLLNLRLDEAVRHFLFLQGNGHLWFVPQLMLFYLILPVIMAVNHLVFRGRPWIILIYLLIALVGANIYFTRDIFSFFGMNYIHYRFFIGTFLSGVFFSYLYYGVYEPAVISEKWQGRIETLCSFIATTVLISFVFGFSEQLWGGHKVLTRDHFGWFGFAAGLLVFCLMLARRSWLSRLLSWKLLQAFSLISFSLYLVHTLILQLLVNGAAHFIGYGLSGKYLYVSTLFVGYFVARYLYNHIENPK